MHSRMLPASSEPMRQFFYTMLASVHRDSFSRDSLPVCLRSEKPNRLVSLWDIVNHFDAFRFGMLLKELAAWYATAMVDEDKGRIVPELIEGSLGTVKDLRAFCKLVRFERCYLLAVTSERLLPDVNVGVVENTMAHLLDSLVRE